MRLIRFIFLLSLALNGFSQKADEDFAKINKVMNDSPALGMEIIYSVFENHTSTIPIDKNDGIYRKRNNHFYTSLMGTETIVDRGKTLTIDKNEKRMVLSPAKPINGFDVGTIKIEELLKVYQKIEFKTINPTTNAYLIYFKSGSGILSKFEVQFNKSTYLLGKLVLFYDRKMQFGQDDGKNAQKPRLEIEFTNVSLKQISEKEIPGIEKYVQLGNTCELQEAYKEYKLIELKN